ncbi:hypothetical protein EDC04DRAFT_3063288 [Pisolithus marmoratus]|nr:hypothetical protein EDC04DRAFT_3063288 [Pisolithus marmoratus]
MSPNGRNERKLDQYHHYIPRFILRRYQVGPVRSKTERQRLFRKTGVDPESVYYWDVAKGTLDLRPIGKVYGVQNLYRDCKNAENVNAIEQKLSVLEARAAFVISNLHKNLPTNKFSVKRRPLEDLRKFLFIMHLRNVRLRDNYYDEDKNRPIQQWVKNYRQTHGFNTPTEAWLGTMQYYLDNSHSQIMAQAAESMDKHGPKHIIDFLQGSGVGPENFPALTYQVHCGSKYTCIWQAAEGEEFVLTHNGFGLWEGLIDGLPGLHSVYVISPRVVIVFRTRAVFEFPTFAPASAHPPIISSDLASIAHPSPVVEYHGSFPAQGKAADLEAYRGSKQAEEDVFHFDVKRLTVAETVTVNRFLLDNVYSDGSVTFASKACMLRTARSYCKTLDIQWNPKVPVLIKLLEDNLATSKTSEDDVDPRKLVHFELFILLMDVSTGKKSYNSVYDRARAVVKLLTENMDFSSVFASELDERLPGHICRVPVRLPP